LVPPLVAPGLTVTAIASVPAEARFGSVPPLESGVNVPPGPTTASDETAPAVVDAVITNASALLPPFETVKVRTNVLPAGTESVAGLQPCSFGPAPTDETVATVADTVLDATDPETPLRSEYTAEAVLEMMVPAGVDAAAPRAAGASNAMVRANQTRRKPFNVLLAS
jgi:hypothetical protein